MACLSSLDISTRILIVVHDRSVFEAIEKHAKTEYGFASVSGVDWENPQHKNEMPRFVSAIRLLDIR